MPDLPTLHVQLHGDHIATLTLLPNDSTLLTFEERYINNPDRPTLSLGFKDAYGALITDHRPVQTRVNPFFANLLPEGALRDYLAKRARVKPEREFHLLWALGQDLPGALRVTPADETAWPGEPTLNLQDAQAARSGALRFSLAGVQLKFSAVAKARGGLTIPASGQGGSWIVKLPSQVFAGAPEGEFAMMQFAKMIGIDVPENRLAALSEIEGLPERMERLGAAAFVVKRFDRRDDGSAIHVEDFAQVFRVFPEDKYEKASYRNIADVIAAEVGEDGIREFVRRLIFNALIGNADMHLKNWSLIYPDRRNALLAPAYDFVSTVQYMPDENMALSLGRSNRFDELNTDQLAYFAAKARLAEKVVIDTALETVTAFDDLWPKAKRDLDIGRALFDSVERHRKKIALRSV